MAVSYSDGSLVYGINNDDDGDDDDNDSDDCGWGRDDDGCAADHCGGNASVFLSSNERTGCVR